MSCYALVDCNNFFASCERVFRPDLRCKPVAVLSNNDACIIARSIEVKALGIKMGQPLFEVENLVKKEGITLFSANFELYGDISQRLVGILRSVTPLIEVYSIDECFLDLSGFDENTNWNTWSKMLKQRISVELGIPVSVGIAPTKTLAKVASNQAKRQLNGINIVETKSAHEQLLADLPVEEIWGVGHHQASKLRSNGIQTAIQLTQASDMWLTQHFNLSGIKMVDELRGHARLTFGDKSDQRKTIMRSRSFGHRIRSYHELERAVATFATTGAAKLRAQASVARKIGVFLDGVSTEGRAKGYREVILTEATSDTGLIIKTALIALGAIYDETAAYKRAGVFMLDVVDIKSWQLSLLNKTNRREERFGLMQWLDTLNKRFGSGTIWHATEDREHASWQSKHAHRSPRYTSSWNELPVLSSRKSITD